MSWGRKVELTGKLQPLIAAQANSFDSKLEQLELAFTERLRAISSDTQQQLSVQVFSLR